MMTSLLLKKFIRLEISNIYSNVLKAKPKKVEQESETFKTTLLKKIREIKYCCSSDGSTKAYVFKGRKLLP